MQKSIDFKNDRRDNRKSWYLKTIMALGRKAMISKTKRENGRTGRKEWYLKTIQLGSAGAINADFGK